MNRQVDEYVLKWPEKRRVLLEELRHLFMSMSPAMEEKFRYKIPFYDHYGILLYISAYPGGDLYIGFVHGAEMDASHGWLSASDRKQIRHFVVPDGSEETMEKLRFLVQEAMLLNEVKWKEKKSRIRKR